MSSVFTLSLRGPNVGTKATTPFLFKFSQNLYFNTELLIQEEFILFKSTHFLDNNTYFFKSYTEN